MSIEATVLSTVVDQHRTRLLADWRRELGTYGRTVASDADRLTGEVVERLAQALRVGLDPRSPGYRPLLELLDETSHSWALKGLTTADTATFVFSMKRPLFELLREALGDQPDRLAEESWVTTRLIDALGLHTVGVHQRAREEVIRRQEQELMELSTPVVKLWDGILALPVIGTLDSARSQQMMELLLQRIVDTGSQIAIIDITGVPTVDTLVAQHLLKTVTAIRLMGAECIVSGIRPQIAQTIVHLGIDLQGVATRASLADALALALRRTGVTVGRT
ncbi:MAG: STAS domain-containing protein [Myxococcota bacterium]